MRSEYTNDEPTKKFQKFFSMLLDFHRNFFYFFVCLPSWKNKHLYTPSVCVWILIFIHNFFFFFIIILYAYFHFHLKKWNDLGEYSHQHHQLSVWRRIRFFCLQRILFLLALSCLVKKKVSIIIIIMMMMFFDVFFFCCCCCCFGIWIHIGVCVYKMTITTIQTLTFETYQIQ